MTENAMRDGILIGSYVPSGIDTTLADLAADYAKRLVDAMDYVGVLAIEFFLTDGELIVNEIAPRVHNTGCLLYTSPSPRDLSTPRMPSSA